MSKSQGKVGVANQSDDICTFHFPVSMQNVLRVRKDVGIVELNSVVFSKQVENISSATDLELKSTCNPPTGALFS